MSYPGDTRDDLHSADEAKNEIEPFIGHHGFNNHQKKKRIAPLIPVLPWLLTGAFATLSAFLYSQLVLRGKADVNLSPWAHPTDFSLCTTFIDVCALSLTL